MRAELIDPYGRKVNYLRLSLTERCNLSCFYCRSDSSECPVEIGKEQLTAEDYLVLGKAAVEMGINRIRLTGGEPLLRQDILHIVEKLSSIPGLQDLSLTTNGVLLERMAFKLAVAGLKRVNISLDSLDEANFKRITKGGKLEHTLKGISEALKAGLKPLKINVVLLKGINDHEIQHFLSMTMNEELDIRFIEYMPVCGQGTKWSYHFLSLDKVVEIASKMAPLIPVEGEHGGGPAQYYRLNGAVGKIGLISPLSRHFCHKCNRLRITSDGKIKPCLFSAEEVDLKPHLADKERIKEKLIEALNLKPDPSRVADNPLGRRNQYQGNRFMTQIGG